MNEIEFGKAFAALTGNPPFPWQRALYDRFVSDRNDNIPASCNLPTGLGKTSVVAVWLIALANYRDKMPRRLVYVVNRRTVVDQTTDEVENYARVIAHGRAPLLPILIDLSKTLRELCSDRKSNPLAISTLRGQFADNREWSADPSRPAVICGTVDMIGSRLLFSGYGCGFKTRPLHAGFLGQDSLLVHDEAHLEPAFQDLLIAIEREQWNKKKNEAGEWVKGGQPRDFRPLRVMELTATSRAGGEAFELTNEEKNPPAAIPEPPTEPIHRVWRRLRAKKGLHFYSERRGDVAKRIGQLARERKASGNAVLIFVRTIDDVKTVQDTLTDKRNGGVEKDQVQSLTGTLRGLERDRLAKEDTIFARFLPDPKVETKKGTVYLVCTSAGEVGVDISADHMVSDLTTLDSMAQRLGRVNRRGDGAAEVDVVFENDPDTKRKDEPFEKARWKTKEILERLPNCDWIAERREASPLCLRNLSLTVDERKAAFAPTPTILPTSDILFDAWALTTVRELPGRPPVAEYLHGVEEDQERVTQVAWRAEVNLFADTAVTEKQLGELLDEFPLKPHELLRDRTYRIQDELAELAVGREDEPVWVIDPDDTVRVLLLGDLAEKDNKKRYVVNLSARIVVLPPKAGGLTETGTLDGAAKHDLTRKYDVAGLSRPASGTPPVRLLVSRKEGERAYELVGPVLDLPADFRFELEGESERSRLSEVFPDSFPVMREAIRFDLRNEDEDADGKIEYLILKPVRPKDQAKHARAWPSLDGHLVGVKSAAEAICSRLKLPPDVAKAACFAAQWHDLGKDRAVWQRGAGNSRRNAKPVAKTLHGRPPENLNHFRHELASMVDVCFDPMYREDFEKQSDDCRELLLHVMATHHGRGRPHFPAAEATDPERPEFASELLVVETPQRFARLQRKYGRWGLAYLESLLRAADAVDSKRIEETPIGDHESGSWPRPVPRLAQPSAIARPSPAISVNVDPTNPGQFFACCGLLELADRLWPGAEGWFEDGKFQLSRGSLAELLASIRDTTFVQLDPDNDETSPLWFPEPFRMRLDWWNDVDSGKPFKTWSGQQTVVRIARMMHGAVRGKSDLDSSLFEYREAVPDPNDKKKAVAPFYFDARRASGAQVRDIGFSPDAQVIKTVSYPVVEYLALVGLQRFRPTPLSTRSFSYSTWQSGLPPVVASAAASGVVSVGRSISYRFRLLLRTQYLKGFLPATSLEASRAQAQRV